MLAYLLLAIVASEMAVQSLQKICSKHNSRIDKDEAEARQSTSELMEAAEDFGGAGKFLTCLEAKQPKVEVVSLEAFVKVAVDNARPFLIIEAAAETIHYDGFSLTNTLSCHQAAWPPMTEAEIDTKFYMYNPSHRPPNGGVLVQAGETTKMAANGFNSNKNTHFVIHGYLSSHFHENFYAIINGFIDKEGANVFAVDWENGAKVTNYNKARQNIRVVGNQAAIFADELGQDISKIHFCGHSLGSHTSGYAGEALKAKGKTLPRITGLDPAGPGFNNENDARCRLDKTDATFVDNIHTDDDMYGTSTEMGHVDFFPNGGANQPGCTVDIASCSHNRVNPLYAETIKSSCNFKSYPCSSYPGACSTNCGVNDKNCNYMGYKASSSKATGRLYLQTNGNSPYCKE